MAAKSPSRLIPTLVLCLAVANAPASTRTNPTRTAILSPWQQAIHARETLESLPETDRTRPDYTRALDAFRAIYHDSPRDLHAPAAIYAVADLLAEQGRLLHDPRSLQAALGQYEFLRTQYPTSSLLPSALLAEAQIDQSDLHDPRAARERYLLLLHTHPHSPQAAEARAALSPHPEPTRAAAAEPLPEAPIRQPAARTQSLARLNPAAIPDATPAPPLDRAESRTQTHSTLPPMPLTSEAARDTLPTNAQPRSEPLPTAARPIPQPVSLPTHKNTAAQVTGIRHWSTANYTRVAIDLGDTVTFEAARVPHPDRIFFDLHGSHLAPELIGKSFAVTDQGFLKRIRAAQSTPDTTRVVLDVSNVSDYSAFLLPNPYRLIIDIHGRGQDPNATAALEDPTPAPAPLLSSTPSPRVAQPQTPTPLRPVPNTIPLKSPATTSEVAAVSLAPGKIDATDKPTSSPIATGTPDVTTPHRRTRKPPAPATVPDPKDPAAPARAALPTATGETSLVRALGLKIGRIVIDAGHGGHDSGTLGVGGIQEKDVVLDVALRLGKLLHERLGAEIIYTRSDDTFIPLEARTAIANKAQADLFLSIHANSSPDDTARGVETYYLNFTQSADALQVAARENAVSGQSVHQLSDLVKKIALKDKIEESREFAADVEQTLYSGLATGPGSSANEGLKNRGVKKAPFVVLIGANMPSILAEISFVTNPTDADQLRRPDYRQRIAESLFKGVAKYEAGLGDPHTPIERASGN
jgi:N-acetylmuramoyl-L-alanine amidase